MSVNRKASVAAGDPGEAAWGEAVWGEAVWAGGASVIAPRSLQQCGFAQGGARPGT
jgi:hypothetical protein